MSDSVDLVAAAKELHARGIEPIPVIGKSPDHLGKGWQNRRYNPALQPELFNSNTTGIGVMLGPSGLVDLEADCVAAEVTLSFLAPPTELVYEHAGRCHRLYRSDASHKEYDCPRCDQQPGEKPTLVEVRAGSHISVTPPSLHEDGQLYTWVENGEPATVDGELLHRAARLAAVAGTLAPHWPGAARNHASLALAGFLRRRGVTEEEAVAVVTGITRAAEDEESRNRIGAVRATYAKPEGEQLTGGSALVDQFGKDVVDHVSRLLTARVKAPTVDPAQVAQSGEPTLTDTGNATRLARAYGNRLRYAGSHGWLTYDGVRWIRDEKRQVVEFAKATVRALYAEAAGELNPYKRKEMVDWAQASENVTRLLAMIKLAESVPAIAISPQELDRDPWLLNCLNGTLDLRTGTRHNHRPEHLITQLAPIEYDPKATCPTWERFLADTLLRRADLINYTRRWVGYTLTGDVSEQMLLFLHGMGSNGKSTFLLVLLALLGSYGMPAAPGLLLDHRQDQHPTRIAELAGKRLVVCVEVGEGKRLAEELVKGLTGGDKQKGRFMYRDFFEFAPTFKLLLAANHKPIIKGTDYAIWRRIPLLPFESTFTEDSEPKKDPELLGKLMAELPGILSWAVRGCREWQQQRLIAPEPVKKASAAYRAEMDVLGKFLSDCCRIGPKLFVSSAALYTAYKEWCGENGERPVRANDFGERLRERGYTPDRPHVDGNRTRGWWGLDLNVDNSGGSAVCEKPPAGPVGHTGTQWDTGSQVIPHVCALNEKVENCVPLRPSVSQPAGQLDLLTAADDDRNDESPAAVREPAPTYYTLVDRPTALAEVGRAIRNSPLVAVDCETTGLDPRRDRVRLLTLTTQAGETFVIDTWKADPKPLLPRLEKQLIVGHNISFDLGFLGIAPHRVADTMILSQLLHAGNDGKHTLQEVAARELGVTLDKTLQTSDWTGKLSSEQLEYAATDTAVLPRLHEHLMRQIEAEGLARAAEIEMRCLPAVVWMSAAGVPVNASTWEALTATNEQAAAAAEAEFRRIAPSRSGDKPWNLGSVKEMLQAFDRVGCHLENTAEETLKRVDHPLAKALLTYRHARKLTSTYGKKWITQHHQEGRVYPSWWQLGSVAGRMSCSKPNMQQIPRVACYRACIAAPPGRTLIKADYSQIEVRIAAVIAGESVMLEAYRAGEDLHTRTARVVTGREEVTKEERQLAKVVNFGLIYGMGAATLRNKLRNEYGIEVTVEEAEQYRDRFFADYPALKRWHRSLPGNKQTVDTRTLTGRRRQGVSIFTFQANTPVQGTGADGLKQALALLWERRSQCPSAVPVIACHDEIVLECDEGEAERAATWLEAAMVDGMADLIAPIPAEVETQIGRTWAG